MISLKDYNLLFSNCLNQNKRKHNPTTKSSLPFLYLYPSQIQSSRKQIFQNEKQQPFTVSQLQSLQQCKKIMEIIQSQSGHIFSPSQQFLIVQHKNPNAEKRFLVISSVLSQNTLSKLAENQFFQNTIVPSELFCAYLIERVLEIHNQLDEIGLHLKVISPQHIVIFQNQIFLNYPFPHDLFESNSGAFMEQMSDMLVFCSPQILKVSTNSKKKQEIQTQNTSNILINIDKNSFQHHADLMDFKKSILYSLGLCILYCFGFHVSLQDRFSGLKNPRQLNKYLDQLRKQIKTHHDGKYISKLLKLMFEHSERLRDTISTFSYKMNSVQFRLLKIQEYVEKTQSNVQHFRTQSQVNSQPYLNSTSGKKTIDIRISAMSNGSSTLNKSWLTISHQNLDNKAFSPSDINKSPNEQKERSIRSKKSIVTNQLNEIQEIKQPQSPIEIECQWDDQSSIHGSNNSSKEKPSSFSSKDNRIKKPTLLNKISEKEQCEEEPQLNQSNRFNLSLVQETQPAQEKIYVANQSLSLNMSPKKENHFIRNESLVSKSEAGIKINKGNNSATTPNDNRLSETDNRAQKKNFKNQIQSRSFPSSQTIVTQKSSEREIKPKKLMSKQSNPFESQGQNTKQKAQNEYLQRCSQSSIEIQIGSPQIATKKNKKLQNQSIKEESVIHQPSTMALFGKQFQTETVQQPLNLSMTLQGDQNHEAHDESFIFDEPFQNDHEYKMEQKLLKQKKVQEKEKVTERKKDQYNERSRIVLVALIAIFGVFEFIDWILKSQQKINEQ